MNPRLLWSASSLVLALAPTLPTRADIAPAPVAAPAPERDLTDALRRIAAGDLDGALAGLDALILRTPNFRLAHLARGDALLARAGALDGFGAAPHADAAALDALRDEARLRLAALAPSSRPDAVPAALLRLAPRERHALVIDTAQARVFVYRNAGDRLERVADFYASHGKQGAVKQREGDQRTPTGVYRTVGWLRPAELTDFYGAGAFPLSYPNAWDRRSGREGFGIWLHGAPSDTYARAPRASDGCVVLANEDLRALAAFVEPGLTPVVIEDGVELVAPSELTAERGALESAVESWRSDWASRDPVRYLAHYARGFASDAGEDLEAWSAHKRRVNAAKTSIEVGLSELSLQRSGAAAVVTFVQDYRSSNLSAVMQKRQYWVREDGAWRIAWEGDAARDLGRPLRSRAQLLSVTRAAPGAGRATVAGAPSP